MDNLLVAAAFVIPLTVTLAWAIWYLVALGRKDRRKHVFRGQGEAVTVSELVEEATEQGEAIRLNWSEEDEARARPWRGTRPYAQDQVGTEIIRNRFGSGDDFPTEILPKVDEV